MNPDAAGLPLRDIHAAAPLDWWPPAPGWWVLTLLAVVLAVWVTRRLWLHYRAWRLKRALRAEYAGILSHYDSNRDGRILLADSATFLRRLVVHIGAHGAQAGVVGEAWADYLSASFPGDAQMHRVCRDLASGAYQRDAAEVDPVMLRNLAAHWIDDCVLEGQARV